MIHYFTIDSTAATKSIILSDVLNHEKNYFQSGLGLQLMFDGFLK